MKYFNRDVLFLHIAVMLFGLSGVVGRFVDLPATAVEAEESSFLLFYFYSFALLQEQA